MSFLPSRIGPPNEIHEPFPVPEHAYGWSAADAAYAMGAYELGPDQALVVTGTSPECVFWNLCLWNPFLHTFDHTYERVTINGAQVSYEPDGSWEIVISDRDPGHPNWVSTARPCQRADLAALVPARTDAAAAAVSRRRPRRGRAGRPVTSTPAPIRFTDLSEPVYPEAAQPIRDGLAAYSATVQLEPDVLCATAAERTGLHDWGDPAFRGRLESCAPRCATKPGCPTWVPPSSSSNWWATWSTGCGWRR